MRLRIVNLELGGQQLPVTKKNRSENCTNLEKHSCLLKVQKKYVFTQISECSIRIASLRIKIKSLDSNSIMNKRKKISAYRVQPEKNDIFIENHKNTAFWPKIRNSPYVCIWIKKYRNDEFKSNQILKKILLNTLRSLKNWHFNQRYWKIKFFT